MVARHKPLILLPHCGPGGVCVPPTEIT